MDVIEPVSDTIDHVQYIEWGMKGSSDFIQQYYHKRDLRVKVTVISVVLNVNNVQVSVDVNTVSIW